MPELFGNEVGLPRVQLAAQGYIPYEVESLTVKRSRTPRAGQTTAVVRVKEKDADAFVTAMVGRVRTVAGVLHRDPPEKCPIRPTQYCTRCEQIDQGESPTTASAGPDRDAVSGWPVPKWARFRVTFENLPYRVETDVFVGAAAGEDELHRYVIRHRVPQSKEQQFPGGAFKIVNANFLLRFPLGATGFRVVVYADVHYTWLRVPVANLDLAAYDACLGHFNTAAFDGDAVGGYNFAAERLLYVGYDDTDKYFDANDEWVCDLVHTWKYREFGWNKFLNNVGEAVEVSSTGDPAGGTKLYTGADFNTLFRTTA